MKTVELIELSVHYRRVCAVKDITLSASEGERIALFGPGGSGKSTLLRVMAGRVPPTLGSVRVLQRSPRTVKSRIGYASETTAGPSLFSPAQLVAKSLAVNDIPGYQRAARVGEALEMVGLYDDRDRPLRELGYTARLSVSVAAAIAHRPAVLLLDNVTGILQETIQQRIRRYVDDRRAVEGMTVIHATTLAEEAEAADRVVLLDSGCVIIDGSPNGLRDAYGRELVMIEAADPDSIRRTLRGIDDVVLEETAEGLRVSAADATPIVAQLFRHPSPGFRSAFIRRASLWDIFETVRSGSEGTMGTKRDRRP
jgi:ABC-2 type transport system ATP-binding protein